MDNVNEMNDSAIAGTSGVSEIHRNSISSSSSDSSSSSSSSSSNSRKKSKNKKKSHRRRNKKRRYDRHVLEKLSMELGELKNTVMGYNYNCGDNDILSDVSGNLYHDDCTSQVPPPIQASGESNPQSELNLVFDFETKLKEPTMPRTPPEYLAMLNEIQRFDNISWSEIRYAETQKTYNHTPGFTELETNELVKEYDNIRHLAYTDKSYAALTFSILKQKEVFINCLRNLVAWSQTEEASLANLNDKIKDIFINGDYHKTSNDILQLVCGHRAETIEMRRAGILKNVRDPLMRATLNKIPPSNMHLFNSDQFTNSIEKFGGAKKTFWPLNKVVSGNASRAKPTNTSRYPIQGRPSYNVPSHGTSMPMPYEPYIQPSRGCHSQCPSQGHNCNSHEPHIHHEYNNNQNRGSSFRSRGSRGRPFQRGRKRPLSPSANRGIKRHRQ